MALQYVGGKTAVFPGTVTATTISLTDLTGGLASAPAADDVVIVNYCVGSQSDKTIGVNTADYTELAELYADDIFDTNLSVSYKKMGGTPDTSVDVSQTSATSDAGAVAIHVWRGVDTTTPIDVTRTIATGIDTGRPNPPAITPTTAGAVVIVCGGAAYSAGAAFTQPGTELSNFRSDNSPDDNDAMVGIGSFAWTSGAFDPVAWTGGSTSSNASWAAVTLALRPAATESPISGSTTLTLTPTGTLAGAGAASGSTTLTFTPSATLAGTGALSGAAQLSFSLSGTIAGAGALLGSSDLSLSAQGNLTGSGSLSASATLAFSLSGTLAGAGALSGASSLTFVPTATLLGQASLSGSTSLTLSASGTVIGYGLIRGSALLSFSASASIRFSGVRRLFEGTGGSRRAGHEGRSYSSGSDRAHRSGSTRAHQSSRWN